VLHIDSVIIIALCVFVIARAALMRREFATYAILGLLALIIAASLDIIAAAEIIPDTVEYLPWGIVLYCIIQTVGMSRDFILIQRRSRRLAVDNAKLKTMLAGRMRAGKHAMTDSVEDKINTAIGYLRENYAEDISRENLAATLDLHPDNFSRYFRLLTGKKYSEFLNDLRVEEAIRLLGRTDLSVITIAMNVGFNSLRTFNHAFMAATGKKPSDFRRQD
jgi:AraC-like DNA-binding protein